ncbi:MAG: uroporphyrinogen decarboxylase family protein [Lachnospiraceae bacterium]|nr:uroporphyrinogen decarboxylase family protein [Lachnospiraceae bacterium]
MYFDMDKWSQDIIDARDTKILPVLYFPCIPLTGYGLVETVNDGKKMAEVMKATVDRYPDMICAMTGMDLSVDSEAFGSKVIFKDNEAPSVKDPLIETGEDIRALQVPDVHAGRVDIFLDAVREASKIIEDRPIIGGQFGPFSLAANLLDVQVALKMTRKDPESMHILLDKCTEFLINRAMEYKKAGANGIFLAEPTAGLLAPKMLEAFSSVYVKRLVDAVQDTGFYVILHNCGHVTKSVESMYGTGSKGHHYGNSVDMKDILPQIPPNILVFGNIDPSTIFFQGTKELMREKTLELLESMKDFPHFILSSGCDLPPMVSMDIIDVFFEACREYNASK